MFLEDEDEEKAAQNTDPYESIKSPVVRDYLRRKAEARKTMESDQQAQKIGDYAGVATDIASGLVNANKPKDVILHNSWQGMGSAPKVNKVADQRIDFSPAKAILDGQAGRSKAAYEQTDKDFESEYKAGQADRNLQTQDSTSKASKSAQILARSALAAKAKEAEAAGDAEAAKALRAMDVSGMSAAEAKDFYDGAKQVDYKDVLSNQAADKRMKMQLASEDKRFNRQQDMADKKEQTEKYRRSGAIREELNKDDTYKALAATDRTLAQVDELMKKPNGTNDQAMIMMFNKALDPGSVVREGEFARTTQGQGLISKAQAYVQKLANGEQLSPEMRQDLQDSMRALREGNNKALQNKLKPYEYEIRNYGLDRQMIINDYSGSSTESPNSSAPESKPNAKKPDWAD